MSADLLTQAIAELDRRVEASTAGTWTAVEVADHDDVEGPHAGIHSEGESITWDDHGGEVFTVGDAELIEMLHQTIPAQRNILLTGRMIQEMQIDSPLLRFVLADANRLARSILEGR